MVDSRIGVNVHDLRLPVKEGLQRAARIGFRAVELRAIGGVVDPDNLSMSGRLHVKRFARDLGLSTAALDADFGANAFADPSLVDACVHKTGQILGLARELATPIVAGRIGRLDGLDAHRREQVLGALRAIGEQADVIGSIYAITTSVSSPQSLREVVDALGCPSIRVCVDPGALVMAGHDPLTAVELLAEQVALSHARDGLAGTPDRGGREVPLGQGHVNLSEYLTILSEAGYAGPQILRRTDSERPLEDLTDAKHVLESQMGA